MLSSPNEIAMQRKRQHLMTYNSFITKQNKTKNNKQPTSKHQSCLGIGIEPGSSTTAV